MGGGWGFGGLRAVVALRTELNYGNNEIETQSCCVTCVGVGVVDEVGDHQVRRRRHLGGECFDVLSFCFILNILSQQY